MNNNAISKDAKRLIFNSLAQDFTSAKRQNDAKQINIKEGGAKESENLQFRAINHQFYKKAAESVYKVRTETGNFPQIEADSFTVVRDMTFKKQPPQSDEGCAANLAREWKLSLQNDCWICNKWNFALVFFNAAKPIEHMEMVLEADHLKELNSKVFIQKKNLNRLNEKRKVPVLSGSLAKWNTHNMVSLRTFCPQIDDLSKECQIKKVQSVSPDPLMRKQSLKNVIAIDKQFSKEILSKIQRYVPCAQYAQVLNWPLGTTTDDVEKNEMWVWLGFVKPGTHQVVVKDLKDRIFTQSLNVQTRRDQVNVRSVIQKKFKEENDSETSQESEDDGRRWEAPSVFENWKQDTYKSMLQAFTIDARFYMLKRNLKGTSTKQLGATKNVINDNFQMTKNVFIDLAAQSKEYPGVCREMVHELIRSWDERSLNKDKVNSIFEQANDQVTGLAPTNVEQVEHKHNSRSQLRRFEFTDLLVLASKIICKSRMRSDYTSDLDLEVDQTMREVVMAYIADYKPRMEWQKFREEILWSQEVNFFFADQITYLASFYRHFSQFKNSKWIFQLNMTQNLFCNLIREVKLPTEDGQVNQLSISEPDIQYCFALSKMTVVDDNMSESQYFKLKFVEMFEFLARVSLMAKLRTLPKPKKKVVVEGEEPQHHEEEEEKHEDYKGTESPLYSRQKPAGEMTDQQACLESLKTLLEFIQELYQVAPEPKIPGSPTKSPSKKK